MRRVFFSFKYYEDVNRACIVRNSGVTQERKSAGFIDQADFEKVKKQGNQAIKNGIDSQLEGTSVTVVLVGAKTCNSRGVRYEIEKSIEIGNGLIGIDISGIKNFNGSTSYLCGRMIPHEYDFYNGNSDDGYDNMGNGIEKAAKKVGR